MERVIVELKLYFHCLLNSHRRYKETWHSYEYDECTGLSVGCFDCKKVWFKKKFI